MSSLPLNQNTLVLLLASAIGIGFFLAGIAEVLEYLIIKLLLFGGFGMLLFLAIRAGASNELNKNRPNHNDQDDSEISATK
jgi:hypothetical protein